MSSGDVLAYPTDTAVSADDFVPTEKVSGNRVFRQSVNPENLKVRPTGSSTARTLAAIAVDLGRVTANVSASDSVTAATSNNAFVSFAQTYTIPASTLLAGSVVKIRALVRVSNASGTDTLTCNLLMGSTSLIATTAVDPGATTDIHILEFEFTARAAPASAASCVGSGRWITNTGGTIAHGTGLLGATNFATNGALVVSSQAKWSSNTASTAALLESLTVEII